VLADKEQQRQILIKTKAGKLRESFSNAV